MLVPCRPKAVKPTIRVYRVLELPLFVGRGLCDDRLMPMGSLRRARPLAATAFFVALALAACSAGSDPGLQDPVVGGSGGSGAAGKGGTNAQGGSSAGSASSGGTGGSAIEIGGSGGAGVPIDPKTCAEAATLKSYIGCDFWPTVTPNSVWEIFDYAVVVANAGEQPSTVTVTRDGETLAEETVEPNELKTLY